MRHFQKVHSDELKATVVRMALDQGVSGAALARMIRAGQIPGFPKGEHINDQTVRGWIKQARFDERTSTMNAMQKLAQQVFDIAQQEIEEIKNKSNPRRVPSKGERVEPDPAKLRKLLETANEAWRVMEHPQGPRKPEDAPVDPADQAVSEALAQPHS